MSDILTCHNSIKSQFIELQKHVEEAHKNIEQTLWDADDPKYGAEISLMRHSVRLAQTVAIVAAIFKASNFR